MASRLVAGLILLACVVRPALGQESQPTAPEDMPVALSDDTLDRIRTALAVEHPLAIPSGPARFYVDVIGKEPTFADYLKGSDLRLWLPQVTPPGTYGSGGGGFDVLQLVMQAVHKVRGAIREHQIRKIRERIDRELAALDGGR